VLQLDVAGPLVLVPQVTQLDDLVVSMSRPRLRHIAAGLLGVVAELLRAWCVGVLQLYPGTGG
jgi:hypothetical protein